MVPNAMISGPKGLEADEMFNACRMVCYQLQKASPHTARHFDQIVPDETVQQYDEELDVP
jgi:hypothetical protein